MTNPIMTHTGTPLGAGAAVAVASVLGTQPFYVPSPGQRQPDSMANTPYPGISLAGRGPA
jgi:hypothetical protein